MSQVGIARRERRRRRRATALLIVTVVALVVAVGFGSFAIVVRSDTSHIRVRAEPFDRQLREVAANAVDSDRRLRVLQSRSRDTTAALTALLAAFQARVDAGNQAVDAANHAVDQYNTGQAGVADAFRAVGDTAVAAVVAQTAAVHAAVINAQTALAKLSATRG